MNQSFAIATRVEKNALIKITGLVNVKLKVIIKVL
jgi:hypothetical protein